MDYIAKTLLKKEYLNYKTNYENLNKEMLLHKQNLGSSLNDLHMSLDGHRGPGSIVCKHYGHVLNKSGAQTSENTALHNTFEPTYVQSCLNLSPDSGVQHSIALHAEKAALLAREFDQKDLSLVVRNFAKDPFKESEYILTRDDVINMYANSVHKYLTDSTSRDIVIESFSQKIYKISRINATEYTNECCYLYWDLVDKAVGVNESVTLIMLDPTLALQVGLYTYTTSYHFLHDEGGFRDVVRTLKVYYKPEPVDGYNAYDLVKKLKYPVMFFGFGTFVYGLAVVTDYISGHNQAISVLQELRKSHEETNQRLLDAHLNLHKDYNPLELGKATLRSTAHLGGKTVTEIFISGRDGAMEAIKETPFWKWFSKK